MYYEVNKMNYKRITVHVVTLLISSMATAGDVARPWAAAACSAINCRLSSNN
jgi:hypothetical protein